MISEGGHLLSEPIGRVKYTSRSGEIVMRTFLTAGLFLLLVGCGDKAKNLFDTARLEEKQNNRPNATKLYRQIVEQHPESPYANQAKTRLAELE